MSTRPRVDLKVEASPGRIVYYRKMVRPSPVEPGSLVDVYDRKGARVGVGYYNPRSELAVRLLASEDIEGALREAVSFRETVLRLPEVTNAYRVCHAEGDGLPGLIVDRYADLCVVEVHALGAYRLLDRVRSVLGLVHVRAPAEAQRLEGFRLDEEPSPPGAVVHEHGIEYEVDFARGHKTGFFCDQRDNRLFFRSLVAGKRVLDLCCYTGGFSLSAAMGGAARVVGVDLDEEALETARSNAKRNRAKIEFLHADLFNYLRQAKLTFDVVVLDPPKMASSREELARAKRAYFDMNRLAIEALGPGGILVSCSCTGLVREEEFLGILTAAARERERELRAFRIAGAGPDHPISSRYPEGRYLKAVFSRVPGDSPDRAGA